METEKCDEDLSKLMKGYIIPAKIILNSRSLGWKGTSPSIPGNNNEMVLTFFTLCTAAKIATCFTSSHVSIHPNKCTPTTNLPSKCNMSISTRRRATVKFTMHL